MRIGCDSIVACTPRTVTIGTTFIHFGFAKCLSDKKNSKNDNPRIYQVGTINSDNQLYKTKPFNVQYRS